MSYLKGKYPINELLNEYNETINALSNLPIVKNKQLPLEDLPQFPTYRELLTSKQELLSMYFMERERRKEIEQQCENIDATINSNIREKTDKLVSKSPFWQAEYIKYMTKYIDGMDYMETKEVDFQKSLGVKDLYTIVTQPKEGRIIKKRKWMGMF
jgi:hypothetical protein